jgi:hypothetical protein
MRIFQNLKLSLIYVSQFQMHVTITFFRLNGQMVFHARSAKTIDIGLAPGINTSVRNVSFNIH